MTNLENVPDFITNPIKADTNIGSQRGFISNTENVPDFIQPRKVVNYDDIEQPKRLNVEVSQELWLDLDKDWSLNQNAVKEYVDALSEDDYQIWKQLKNEGYSLEARKALMENQDLLYDISEPGNKKYYSWNKSSIRQGLMNLVQESNILYEDSIHPWSISAQDWLNEQAMNLDEKYSWENIYGKNIERIDPYNNTENALVRQGQIYATSVVSNLKREWVVLAKMGIQLASLWVNFFDNLVNLNLQWQANLVNPSQEKIDKYGYDAVTIDPNKRSTILGSYLQMVEDVFWVWFIAAYPVASFIFTELADSNPTADYLLSLVNGWFENVAEKIMDIGFVKKRSDKNLSEEDKEYLKRDIAQWLFIVTTAIMWWWWKKFSQTEMYKNWETSLRVANEFWKRWASESLKKGKAIKDIIWEQPTWTELLNNKGKPIAVSTENGWQLTPRGSLNLLLDATGSYWKSFKEALIWRWKYKDKHLVTRDPNAPVWELPWVPMVDEKTPGEEIPVEEKPTQEIKTEEVKDIIEDVKETTKPKLRKAATVTVTPKKTTGEWVSSFIKRVSNDIAWTEGWLNQELLTKLKSSSDLQNEYVNTIDPYLKANWSENPEWAIKDQLADFVETAKNQLDVRRWYNQDFRSWQMKYRTEIPETEKAQWSKEDADIKNLIKILNKSQDNPAQFLEYLLKLPQKTTEQFNKYIPNFSQNLALIKDTLDITKAITKPDLVDKFLSYKSGWGGRKKWFFKRMLYKYLRDTYRKAWVEFNQKRINELLNNMSEEQFMELEDVINAGWDDLPSFMKEDFYNQIVWYDKRQSFMWLSDNQIENIKNAKPEEIYKELLRQGYQDFSDSSKPFKTEEDIRNFKLSNWMTVWEIADAFKLSFKPAIFEKLGIQGKADLVNMIVYFNQNLSELYAQFAWHEIGHHLLWALTTAEYLDLMEWFSKATQSLKEYKKGVNISQYPSLAKSQLWATEYLPDLITATLTYGDINWLASYLQPYLSESLGKKVTKILNEVGKNLWDNFSSVLVNWKEFNPRNEITNLIDKIGDTKIQEAPKYDILPKTNKGIGYNNRLKSFQKIDSNVKWWDIDLDKNSSHFGEFTIELKDGKKLSWEEYKNTLSSEQKKNLYKSDYELSEWIKDQIIEWEESLPEFWKEGNKYQEYKDIIRDVDPDIVGLIDKDWELYVQVLQESMRERWELPDRPWMLELKTIPGYEFFTEEQISKFPKELQDLINTDKWLYQWNDGWLNYSEWKNLKLGNWYYFGSRKQAKQFGPALLKLEPRDWKLYDAWTTNEYQVEASKNGWKEAFNKKLKEQGYEWIKAKNPAFDDYEYNFFSNPFK